MSERYLNQYFVAFPLSENPARMLEEYAFEVAQAKPVLSERMHISVLVIQDAEPSIIISSLESMTQQMHQDASTLASPESIDQGLHIVLGNPALYTNGTLAVNVIQEEVQEFRTRFINRIKEHAQGLTLYRRERLLRDLERKCMPPHITIGKVNELDMPHVRLPPAPFIGTAYTLNSIYFEENHDQRTRKQYDLTTSRA